MVLPRPRIVPRHCVSMCQGVSHCQPWPILAANIVVKLTSSPDMCLKDGAVTPHGHGSNWAGPYCGGAHIGVPIPRLSYGPG